jgi:hypothetical protein
MKSKNSQVLKNCKQLSVVTLLAFGSCLLIISGFGIASVAYGAFPGEITNAENIVKTDISHEQAVANSFAEEKFPTPAIP